MGTCWHSVIVGVRLFSYRARVPLDGIEELTGRKTNHCIRGEGAGSWKKKLMGMSSQVFLSCLQPLGYCSHARSVGLFPPTAPKIIHNLL